MSEQTEQELYLHEHRAWNWQWPNKRNCWNTKSTQRRGPSQAYSGPSKRVIAQRATRRAKRRTRRAH